MLIAFIIYSMLLFYLWVKITLLKKNIDHTYRKPVKFNNFPIFVCIILVLFTIVTGAFVAGTKAGWAYNNFPLMGESLLPPVLLEKSSYSILYLLSDIGFIQFFHRVLASTTLFFIIFTSLYLLKTKPSKQINMLSKFLLAAIILQYVLGVIILKFYIPISLGVMHQFGSLVVISLLIMILGEKMSMGVQTNSQYTFKLIKNFYL